MNIKDLGNKKFSINQDTIFLTESEHGTNVYFPMRDGNIEIVPTEWGYSELYINAEKRFILSLIGALVKTLEYGSSTFSIEGTSVIINLEPSEKIDFSL